MKKQKRSVLVIAAHPDDEICCAGTLLKLKDKEYEISEVVLTGGGEGGAKEERVDEMKKASEFLGMEKVYFLDQEDLGLTYSKELMLKVMRVVREVKPEIVFLMNKSDFHPDHRAAFEIGIEAVKYASTGIRLDLGDPCRAKVVLAMGGMWPIRPDLMVDVTDYKEKKMKMFSLHESQVNSKAVKFEESMLAIYGYQHRTGDNILAEPFEFCPEFPSSGMVDL